MWVDGWARSWFMIENSFEVGIFRFDWRLFTKEDTAGHGGIWGVRSGMKGLWKNISLAAVSLSLGV